MAETTGARGSWVTRQRVTGYATLFAVTEMLLFAFFVAGAHGLIVPLEHPTTTDFVSFHAAGALADAGTPWLAYDRAAHQAAETAAVGFPSPYNYFYYPPVFLLICALLARLPYLAAFLTFQAAGAAACFFSLRRIRPDFPPAVFLAFPGLWWAMGTGQNALMTAALFALGTALLERRSFLAGLCLGALCYKPHFGLLIPVALIAGGYWRAILGAAVSASGLIALSILCFGLRTWAAFWDLTASSGDVYAAKAIFMGGLTSPFGVLMTLGVPRAAAIGVQAAVILLAVGIVAVVWRRRPPFPVRAAVLLAATPVAVPILMFYDLMIVLVALVWLTNVTSPRGTSFGRAFVMALIFLAALFSGNLGDNMRWMSAAIAALLTFVLTMTVAWRAMRTAGESAISGPG